MDVGRHDCKPLLGFHMSVFRIRKSWLWLRASRTDELEALTFLLLLHCAAVPFLPLLTSWRSAATPESWGSSLGICRGSTWRFVFRRSASSLETVVLLEFAAHWEKYVSFKTCGLILGRLVLYTHVLSMGDMLNRRLRGPIMPCSGHAKSGNWDFAWQHDLYTWTHEFLGCFKHKLLSVRVSAQRNSWNESGSSKLLI